MKIKKGEIIILSILILFLIFLFVQTFYFPDISTWDQPDENSRYSPTAATWPRIVIVTILILCVWSLIVSLVKNRSAPTSSLTKIEKDNHLSNKSRFISTAFVLLIFAYLFAIEFIGFPLGTFILGFLIVILMRQKEEKIGREIISVAIISVVIIMLFSRFLYLPLPKGIGVFRKLSELVIF